MSKVHLIDRDFVQNLEAVEAVDLNYPESKNNTGEYIGTIVNNYLKDTVKKGDALVFETLGYRGANVYFWDGNYVIMPGTDYTDYGNVPESFLVQDGKFAPDHWSELATMSKRDLGYIHFSEITLGPKLKKILREKAIATPCIVKVTINGNEFSFFIQKNKYKEDIEDSWYYYTGNNTVVQADVDDHADTNWHPEAQDFKGILARMNLLKGGKRQGAQTRKSNYKKRKTIRRSRK